MEGWIFSHFQKFGWATKAGEKDGLQKKLVSWQYSTMEFSCELWEYTDSCHIHVEANGDTADRIKPVDSIP